VSTLSSAVLKRIQARALIPLAELELELSALLPDVDVADELVPTLQNLAENGLLQPAPWYAPATPRLDDSDD
jgi:hypothetical protein